MSNLPIVVGLDPSSRKLAAVATRGTDIIKVETFDLPEKQPYETCTLTHQFVSQLVWGLKRYGYDEDRWGTIPKPNRVYVFVEAPVMAPKAGPGSLIPQAQVSGAILAACGTNHVPAELVYIQTWKLEVIGNGNASKSEVALWCRQYWRSIYRQVNGDQDLVDAAAINRYGANFVRRLERLEPPRKRIRKAI